MRPTHAAKGTMDGERGFWALMFTQFQGAFNDNAFKVMVIFLMPLLAGNDSYPATAIAFLVFNLPFLLFPSYAGYFADQYSKKRVTIFTKYWEVLVMALGLIAFSANNIPLLWTTLFLMAMQSAFFSPAKYGILPEILKPARLSWGNGVLQLGTMIAIIGGTAIGAPLVSSFSDHTSLAGVLLVALSITGVISSHCMPNTRPASPGRPFSWNPWNGLGRCFGCFCQDRKLFASLIGIAYFWFAGTLAMQTIIELAKATISSTAMQGQLLTALSLGIGVGSVVAGLLSRKKIQADLIPLGGMGMALISLVLGSGAWRFPALVGFLFGLGFFGGLFVIPLDAMLQQRSPSHMRGDMIASSNFVTFTGMTGAAVLFYGLFNLLGLSSNVLFIINGVMSILVCIYVCARLPLSAAHLLARSLAFIFYRLRVHDADQVPETGGALIVANHTSFVDALILSAATDRKVRFIMDQGWYDLPLFRPVCRWMKVIPIAGRKNPDATENSLRAASAAIEAGELVCIFAEGAITRTGEIMPFRRGLERIMKNCPAPIIPVHLGNLWGSIFSFKDGRVLWKKPRRLAEPVTVRFGTPLHYRATSAEVREAVVALTSDMPPCQTGTPKSLGSAA